MKYSPKKMQEHLNENNFHLKKQFGQNFIIDENIINNIVDKANIDSDTMILEIGPGAGSLTYKLASACKNVLCYEIDTSLEKVLLDNLSELSNVEIVFKDFLKANVLEDIKKYNFKKLYVVANLPYYITTPIITKIIEDKIPADRIVVMVQKEVGDRFKAKPNSKEYNSLSIYLNYYYDTSKLMDVSKNVFLPKPNVDSIIVCFDKKKDKIEVDNEELFFKLVKDSFTQKRKNLRNNLKGYNLEKIEIVLKKYNLDLNVRAEALSINQFAEIANELGE
jgi:dimethyladenosine transferase